MRAALIDTSAIAHNVRHVKKLAGVPEFIAVVKADGYGHGAARTGRAAIEGGATRIGTADLDEALALIRDRIATVPILAWLHSSTDPFAEAAAAGIEIGVSSVAQLDAAANAFRNGRPTTVHIKVETGLGRGGAAPAEWPALFAHAHRYQDTGRVRVLGLFSTASLDASPWISS